MKEAIIRLGPKVEIVDSPIPSPEPNQVVIKVVVSGSNPKDWKYPEWRGEKGEMNQGDDIAGIVHAVGSGVYEFKPGDRVGAFHEMQTPHGSYAEYAVAWAHTTFHIPEKISFEEVATIPLAAMTSAVALFHTLAIPPPWEPAKETLPIVIYGGASAIGAYAIKFAQRANLHPIITVAGRAQDFVNTLLDKSKGDIIIDYRKGDDHVSSEIEKALRATGVKGPFRAYDGITDHNSWQNVAKAFSALGGGKIGVVLPPGDDERPTGVEVQQLLVSYVHQPDHPTDFGHVFFRYIAKGLHEGWFTGHPYEVVPGGLAGVEKGLTDLKHGRNSAKKYVFEIEQTPKA